jgi:hypothetical protein
MDVVFQVLGLPSTYLLKYLQRKKGMQSPQLPPFVAKFEPIETRNEMHGSPFFIGTLLL